MKIGIQELLVVFVVALIVVGPDKLPMYAKKLGIALAQFRKFSEDATKDIRESIVEPLEEAQRPLREAMEPITELEKTVKSNVNDIQKSFADIGKPKKSTAPASKEAEEPTGNESEESVEKEAVQPEASESGDDGSSDSAAVAESDMGEVISQAEDTVRDVSAEEETRQNEAEEAAS